MRRVRGGVLGTLVFAVVASCSNDGVTNSARISAITLNPSAVTIAVGAVAPITAELRNADGQPVSGPPVFWSSSDTSIASVSAAGVVTARAVGAVLIAASSQGLSATAEVTVSPQSVATVQVSPPTSSIRVGGTQQLRAVALDGSGGELGGRVFAWSSSNPSIASVDNNGLVTARLPGAVSIFAGSEGRTGSAAVTVTLIPVSTVTVAPDVDTLNVGATRAFAATLRDDAGTLLTGRTVTWNSNATQVATVSSQGVVTAISPGTTTISASSEGRVGTAEVVVRPRPVASVTVSPANTSLTVGNTTTLTATLRDDVGGVATGRVVTWQSSNSAIASVSQSGVVSAVAAGDVVITATSEGRNGTAAVRVNAVPVATVQVTPAAPTIVMSQSVALSATARAASGQVLTGREVRWSSGSPAIAAVNGNGVVSGISPGNALIVAEVDGVTGSTVVTVQAPIVSTVSITPQNPVVALGSTRQLNAIARDAQGNEISGRPIIWTSSDETSAFVTSTGLVITLRRGSATITATVDGVAGTTLVTIN